MIRRPPRSTRTDTLFPYTTVFRSAGAEALHATIVLVAVRLIDLPLATQFSFLGPDANAVGLDRAVAAPLAHCRIDEHALCGIGELAALAPTSLFGRSEEHTSELQSLMRNSYAVFCLKTTTTPIHKHS